ncbi:B-box zinc finger protein 21-like [Andrographis paniculata]|uniref:B-box zinc finger protein 21-like n=1 Tax=Andrographis paniculata TaxID=175694 RepID=UPI0021E88B7A|nr:B-box zinc finger protein 21-like [Andrographis paniculata]
MKILCDVCDKNEASLFCVADEAALCAACDHRVHHANKLAGKHQRFSLHHPSPKHAPLCDICQERKAFMFCRQDRAILCRDCDLSIHRANKHTQNHTRFLLTGMKLSANSSLYSSSPAITAAAEPSPPPPPPPMKPSIEAISMESSHQINGAAAAASSISEYLIEMLPGWHVEELLDSSFSYNGFCKSGGGGDDDELQKKRVCVPQFQTELNRSSSMIMSNLGFDEFGFGFGEDSSFVVPQMSQLSSMAAANKKRSRNTNIH